MPCLQHSATSPAVGLTHSYSIASGWIPHLKNRWSCNLVAPPEHSRHWVRTAVKLPSFSRKNSVCLFPAFRGTHSANAFPKRPQPWHYFPAPWRKSHATSPCTSKRKLANSLNRRLQVEA